MVLPAFISYINDTHFFLTNDYFNLNTVALNSCINELNHVLLTADVFNIQSKTHSSQYSNSLITFINQTEDLNLFNALENTTAVYHYSIPNVKLAYPEPFVASASFMHTDLWFIHILIYQYWLWFVFIFIIVFFILMFVCTIRWCNMRIRPRRETRGISRSKCGDLVTACVPVTWATSIIINESTDAIDYYDGFGTTELVVGIRAYQWGWEYYYPKDIDLNYNLKPNYSVFIGNSLKYNRASETTLNANNLWKFYQNKNTDQVVTPAHLLILPIDNYKILNFFNFNDLGANPIHEQNAFKRVRAFSKNFTSNLTYLTTSFNHTYQTLTNLYCNDTLFSDSYLYGLKKQHNFVSSNSITNNNATFFNLASANKILNYTLKQTNPTTSLINVDNFYAQLSDLFDDFSNWNNLRFNKWTTVHFIKSYRNSLVNDSLSESTTTFDNADSSWATLKAFNETDTVGSLRDYPYSPIGSNNPAIDLSQTQKLPTGAIIENLPVLTLGKDEILPQFFTNIYSTISSSNELLSWKLYNTLYYHSLHRLFYLPVFNFYYDYDFRNWQMMELLEDAVWESVYSIYNHDEYANLAEDFYNDENYSKVLQHYNTINRLLTLTNKTATNSIFVDNNVAALTYPNTVYTDDFVSPTTLITTKDFAAFPIFSIFSTIDDSYEAFKYLNYLFYTNNKVFLTFFNFNLQPHSTLFVLDMFRANYEDFSWFTDENNTTAINMQTSFYKLIESVCADNVFLLDLKTLNTAAYTFLNDLTFVKTNRFNNPLNLRLPAKNAIVTYNAIQKVFRTRFDEGRSNVKLTDLSLLHTKQPIINADRVPYEAILGKNKKNFLQINTFKTSNQFFFNNFYDLTSSLNFYFYDFPFLIAMKSDASRYFWFDWFAKWGFYEVQPSSSARYAIYGMPYLTKAFEFNAGNSENLTESETYLLRIARARKNYLPNWTYTPYLYAKNTTWYRNNLFYEILQQSTNSLEQTIYLLNNMSWYWTNITFLPCTSYHFFPSHSNLTSNTKLGWKPQNSIQSYYYTVSTLIDILTKREYLYRELFMNSNRIVSLPLFLTNNTTNPLINEIKASFLFIDPVIYNNEYSRDIYFNSLNFFNFTVIKSVLLTCGDLINLNLLNNYLFYYFFNPTSSNLLQKNVELYKNQFRPLRKGVTNMIRLHATGAIAMPIEIRLQIMASSKDVIHSWAIPSAGIKMDCIPGYSSHKVFIFLVSGIFWGQCMEICGRYHHWMPIVVYFMKRDLFFLWCTHFVFLTGANNMWNINDRQFVDYLRVVSFDKYSWLSELNN